MSRNDERCLTLNQSLRIIDFEYAGVGYILSDWLRAIEKLPKLEQDAALKAYEQAFKPKCLTTQIKAIKRLNYILDFTWSLNFNRQEPNRF